MNSKPANSANGSQSLPPGSDVAYLHWAYRPNQPPLVISPFTTIGRDASCAIVIDDELLSDRHVRFEKRGATWTLRDLQSKTGVLVNDVQVADASLKELDQIKIGTSMLLFSLEKTRKGLIGSKNEEWNTALSRLPAFAQTDFPLLLTGPSGSGKEVLARAVHQSSRRANGPMVTINCGALSESLIESELFGHVRGSFTGATHDRQGAFETARGGTLFLDEIGDFPLGLQPKLLRALENSEIRPVGSDRTVHTDVRIIAATHKDLGKMVRTGRFRADLFWRLNVCVLCPPALNERMEDFTDLVYEFCKQMRVGLSHGAIERLRQHTWRGNVRELRNLIARARAYFPGERLDVREVEWLLAQTPNVEPEQTSEQTIDALTASSLTVPSGTRDAHGSVMREIEREMIVRRLLANGGNQRKTAIELGMPKSTLHDRLKSYSIDLEEIRKVTGATPPSATSPQDSAQSS